MEVADRHLEDDLAQSPFPQVQVKPRCGTE